MSITINYLKYLLVMMERPKSKTMTTAITIKVKMAAIRTTKDKKGINQIILVNGVKTGS